jgi:uncharacterized protein (DUF2336 family)
MVVGHFLKWIDGARVAERAAAAQALANAYVGGALDFDDRCAAEAALTLLLDDPSSKVRAALAEALSMSRHAPAQIVAALSADQPEVACFIIARSPLLTDGDLIERVVTGTAAQQRLVASRPSVSMSLAAAIAEIGEPTACIDLVGNIGADIASISFRRLVERHGDRSDMREALIADPRLPSDCRHMLLIKLGKALRSAPLVVASMGSARADRLTQDACVQACLTLVQNTPASEHAALIEHLRLSGDLTASLLVRAVAHGKIDFLAVALVALSGKSPPRITALLASGHDVALTALFAKAGLSRSTHRIILRALKLWREVANGRRLAGVQEVTWLMLQEAGEGVEQGLLSMLKSLHLQALRDNARQHARSIAAA